jgi:pilus assembly protein CpaF
VVGEVRGDEALDMVMALNTGHDGSLTTCHGNGPEDTLRRLEAMVLMGAPTWPPATARDHVRGSVDVVIHVQRGEEGRRVVAAVVEVEPPGSDSTGGGRLLARGGQVLGEPTRLRGLA